MRCHRGEEHSALSGDGRSRTSVLSDPSGSGRVSRHRDVSLHTKNGGRWRSRSGTDGVRGGLRSGNTHVLTRSAPLTTRVPRVSKPAAHHWAFIFHSGGRRTCTSGSSRRSLGFLGRPAPRAVHPPLCFNLHPPSPRRPGTEPRRWEHPSVERRCPRAEETSASRASSGVSCPPAQASCSPSAGCT
jgi:hypothetical protein